MGAERQKNRRKLALARESRGEAPTARSGGIEAAMAVRETESPAVTS